MLSHRHNGLVKAATGRMVWALLTNVPFAENTGGVPSLLQLIGHSIEVERERGDVLNRPQRSHAPVKTIDAPHRIHAGTGPMLAAHQRGAGGRAILAVMMIGEAHALPGEPVDVRRLVVVASEAAEIGPAEIIGHDEHDVW